jgi:hypothetical protein
MWEQLSNSQWLQELTGIVEEISTLASSSHKFSLDFF